ncbi:MAG: Spy/CpxP family protein refolding chaperone [bacterium]
MKNSTLKFLLLISVILNIVILASVFYSYYTRRYYAQVPFRRHALLVKELSLTPVQERLFEEKEKTFFTDIDTLRKQIFVKRIELLNLMEADQPDMKKIHQTIADIGSMQEAIQQKVVNHLIGVKSILNKEQQKKFFKILEGIITKREYNGHGYHGPNH